jgi:hypothetical protein
MWLMPSVGTGETDFDSTGPPPVGPVGRWAYGVVLAGIPVAAGIYALLSGRAWFLGRSGPLKVTGPVAVALGIACIAVGAFTHFHFFWTTHARLAPAATYGKIASLVAFIGALGFAVVVVILDIG